MTYRIFYMPKDEANCCKDYTMFDMEYGLFIDAD